MALYNSRSTASAFKIDMNYKSILKRENPALKTTRNVETNSGCTLLFSLATSKDIVYRAAAIFVKFPMSINITLITFV